MARLPIVLVPNQILKAKAKPVPSVDDTILRLLDDMLETMYDAPGIGLSGNQVGMLQRVIVLDVARSDEKPQPLKMVNPELLWVSDELSTYNEGCLSLPEQYADVTRPAHIKLRFLDEKGHRQEMQADGLLATCVQHEIDHLDGILFVDHISALKRNMILRKLAKAQKAKSEIGHVMAQSRLRLAFMGTPEFAVPILDALAEAGHEIAAVYSQPPRPTGRGHRTQPSPVQTRAEALGLPVRHPLSLKPAEAQVEFAELGLDAAIVAAYGLILPKPILSAPRLGCLNVHASLLPRWRGAAPIQRALLAGDAETGVTIMQMEAGLDTGPMLLAAALPIVPDSTATALQAQLAALGARLILDALDRIIAGTIETVPQPENGVTYAAKVSRTDSALAWNQPATVLERQIRALTPWPGVSIDFADERIKVLAASAEAGPASAAPGTLIDSDFGIACGQGVFRPILLQRPGRAPVDRRAFLNGLPVPKGFVLASG